jgi:cutinase
MRYFEMHRRTTVTGVAAALLAGGMATAAAPPAAAAECKAVSIISARGTWEPQDGSWLQKPIGDKISGQLPNQAKYTELTYPATVDFNNSAPQGVTNLIQLLNTEAAQCPAQKYVLTGYSQGAGVVGDALASPAQRIWGNSAGQVGSAAAGRISAILLFGDIRFAAGEPYNVGTFEPGEQSVSPPARPKGALNAYANRIQDYCVKNDFVCQGGSNFLAHLEYFTNSMPDQGVKFAVQKVQG